MLVLCIEAFMVFHCPFHVIKFSWFLVILLGELKLCVEVPRFLVSLWMHWNFMLFNSKVSIWLNALKLYCVEALSFLVIFWVHWSFFWSSRLFVIVHWSSRLFVLMHWSSKVFSQMIWSFVLRLQVFCFGALKLCIEVFCFGVLKLCVEAPSSLL
jgi:hypothetical protein